MAIFPRISKIPKDSATTKHQLIAKSAICGTNALFDMLLIRRNKIEENKNNQNFIPYRGALIEHKHRREINNRTRNNEMVANRQESSLFQNIYNFQVFKDRSTAARLF